MKSIFLLAQVIYIINGAESSVCLDVKETKNQTCSIFTHFLLPNRFFFFCLDAKETKDQA
jgi:hypothetical protein